MNARGSWWLMGLLGCGGSEVERDFVLAVNARTSTPNTIGLGTYVDRVSVGSVWLRLGEVTLTGDCGAEPVETTVEALGLLDHADAAAVTQKLDVAADTICTVDTTLEIDPEATDEPEGVAGTSVAVLGELVDGRAFEVLIREEIPLSLVLEDEPVPDAGTWLLSFDVAAWLDPAGMSAVSGFPITVTADTNPALYSGLLARLVYGVQIHLDADDDGVVDPTERRIDIR